MEHGCAQRIYGRTRLDLARKQLWRRIAHRSDRSHTFLGWPHGARYTKIHQHDSASLVVQHQVGGFQVPIDDRRYLGMYVAEHFANLNCPLCYNSLFNSAARQSHLFSQVPPADPLHHQVVPAAFYEVIINSRNGWMLELGQHFRFALEIIYSL